MPDHSTQVVLPSPTLSWCDGQPVSNQFNDPYFSADNGLAETRHVFLQHNGLPERWQQWPWAQSASFNIIETGFGTGLNFLATWQLWRQHLASQQPTSGWLHFTSIEKYPLTREQLQQALALWPELAELTAKLLASYPLPLQGPHYLVWPEEKLSLTLWLADIQQALPEISAPVHAWLLDGFAPSRNPEMWNDTLFHWLRRISQSSEFYSPLVQPTLATFTSAGMVKRGLQGAGFSLTKGAGFGRKRDMIFGQFNFSCGPEQPSYYWQKPWLTPTQTQPIPQTIAVIGAGLAGCFTARSLAERGIQVKVFDPQGIATQASGNAQGGIYIKLNAGDSALLSNFYLAGFQHALQRFQHYLGPADSNNSAWQQCGLIQLAFDSKEQQRQQRFLADNQFPAELLHPIDAQQASEIAGIEVAQGGLFFPQAGWLSPRALCQQLLRHPNIQFQQQQVTGIHPQQQQWRIDSTETSFCVDQVVLANAEQATKLLTDYYLPLKSIRGQLSYVDAQQAPTLKTVLSGQCYVAPAINQQMCVGATFDLNDSDPTLRETDHLQNMQHLDELGKPWLSLQQAGLKAIIGGKVGFRCAAPDYMPIVGSVVDERHFIQHFKAMIKDSKAVPKTAYQPVTGLWLNIAHGAKGLVSTPLCAELLTSQITRSGAPFGKDIIEALWPGRLLLKDMTRRKLPKHYDINLR